MISACACLIYGLSPITEAVHPLQIDFKYAYELKIAAEKARQNIDTSKEVKILEQKYLIKNTKNLLQQSNRLFYVDKDGYPRYSNSHKLIHRCNMEKFIGRKLNKEEVVHHKDGDKRNFRINNLRLFVNQNEHDKFHRDHYAKKGYWHEKVPRYNYGTRYA